MNMCPKSLTIPLGDTVPVLIPLVLNSINYHDFFICQEVNLDNQYIFEEAKKTRIIKECDVLVAGGGIGGVSAAKSFFCFHLFA